MVKIKVDIESNFFLCSIALKDSGLYKAKIITIQCGFLPCLKIKTNNTNKTNSKREKLEIYCWEVFTLHVKWCNAAWKLDHDKVEVCIENHRAATPMTS